MERTQAATNQQENTSNSRRLPTNSAPRTHTHDQPSSSKIPILSRSFSTSRRQQPPAQYHYLQAKHKQKQQKPPSPTPSGSSSSATDDLFAGPRTSIHLDPLTGQLLSAGHDVSAMDALIDNLKKDPSSPQRRKPYQQRSAPRTSQLHPSSSSSSNPLRPPTTRLPSSSSTLTSLAKIHSQSTNDLPSIHRSAGHHHQSRQHQQPTRLASTSDLNSQHQSSRSSNHPKLSLRCFSRSSNHPAEYSSSHPLPPIHLHSPSQAHPPLPTPPPSAIPTINGIIEKYSKKINYSAASRSPQLKIDSIDEIVEKYNPLLKRSALHHSTNNHPANHTQSSDPKHLCPLSSDHNHPHPSSSPITRLRSLSENSDDSHSSINSLTKEALSLQALLSSQAERLPHPTPLPRSPSGSPKILRPDPDSLSKRSASPIHRSPLKQSSTTEDRPSARAQVDDPIALYLRSTRLTTLIKLERQQSPMTVSLADVGSPTGHPVVIFLGLGCVRYLVGLYDELAEALGLRLICIDRWGLGKTTEVPDEQRGFLEWASVVEEVADQLSIGRFSILAHSAGAPYALAASLRLADRVFGSIHLLAPWVSMTAEGGINAGAYKWLKYIPNSMIKTVQAAEWKMTGWRLGKPPTLNHPPVGFDARAPVASSQSSPLAGLGEEEQERGSLLDEEAPEPDIAHRPSLPPPLLPLRRGSKRSGTSAEEVVSKSRASVESSDCRSIATDSSMGKSRHTLRFNGSSSTLASGHKHGLFGKFFPSQSHAIVPDSTKHPDPLSPSDHSNNKPSIAICDSPHGTPIALLYDSIASPVPSLVGGSYEDVTDERNGVLHQPKGHSPLSNKRTSQKMKYCYSESRYGNVKKQEDVVEGDGRPTRSQTMLHQPPMHLGASSSSSSTSSHHVPGRAEDVVVPKEETEEGKSGMRRSLGISLLRASYSESLRGGTSDLITILEKNSKPWGFSYAEIATPVKIWHGSKDERLAAKGSQWFINSITRLDVKNRSELVIVNDATHSLMTDVNVLYQVFESIADQWASSPNLESP
ncbi:hypothetical protein PtB15_3B689 [Puccinia triticina]|nr:hypothetical protein PtB15_3B689 [Puccinia triticina]